MKKEWVYFILILLPFLGLGLVNEVVRDRISEHANLIEGVVAINTGEAKKRYCTWACHNNTLFCKRHHVKYVSEFYDSLDPLYFGIINGLKSSGNYKLGNIIILAILIPSIMVLLLVRVIGMEYEIRELKREKGC